MIVFMEGLPRSGKSYETCAFLIMSALQKGRNVDAYVEGLNHEKYSELTGIPLPIIKKMLVQIDVKQVPTIYQHVRKDALVVIDELQDFFPQSRQPMSNEMTTFVTQHGHDGLDIVAMGQDLTDCHKMWRNRVDRKYVFQKKDVVGKPTHYHWTSYKAVRSANRLSFVKIRSGSREYDKNYFGLYKSHSDGTTNFDTFEDDRTNLMKGKAFTVFIPLFCVVFIFCIWYLYTSYQNLTSEEFDPADETTVLTPSEDYKPPAQQQFDSLKSQFDSLPSSTPNTETLDDAKLDSVRRDDYVKSIADKYRLRLGGIVTTETRVIAQIDAFDERLYLKESFSSRELESLGWNIEVKPFGVLLAKDDLSYVVRSWPIDIHGRVNATTAQAL